MRNFRLTLISIILVLATFCTLAGCLANGADASPILNDGEGEEMQRTYVLHFDPKSDQEGWVESDLSEEQVNRANFVDPDITAAPGKIFSGWYLTEDYAITKAVKLMSTEEFWEAVATYGQLESETNIMHIYLYAKWISSQAKPISDVKGLFEIRNEPEANYILTQDIDLSTFDRYATKVVVDDNGDPKLDENGNFITEYVHPGAEHYLDPDEYESEEEMNKVAEELKKAYKKSWIPIAYGLGKEFVGTFDGNGHEIRGMNIVLTKHDRTVNKEKGEKDLLAQSISVGLFGLVSGKISNLSVVDYTIEIDGDVSHFDVGGIAGRVAFGGEVNNCLASGTIINKEIEYTGNMWDSLFGSYAEPTTNSAFGGAVGYLGWREQDSDREGKETISRIQKTSTSGKVTSETNEEKVYVGGVVGCVSQGRVTSSNSASFVKGRYAGGLIGNNNGNVLQCYATGGVEGSTSYPGVVGGLVGYNYVEGTIERCYAEGNVNARTAGGLVGINVFNYKEAKGGTIRDCLASGNVLATEYAGGLVGRATAEIPIKGREEFSSLIYNKEDNYGNHNNEFYIIERCFAFGDVEANAEKTIFKDEDGNEVSASVYYSVFAGGLIGQSYEQLVRRCFAFGDVTAISLRSKMCATCGNVNPTTYSECEKCGEPLPDDNYAENTAFAGNFVGHTTNMVVSGDDSYVANFCLDIMEVTRNGKTYPYATDGEVAGTIVYPNQVATHNYAWFKVQSNFTVGEGAFTIGDNGYWIFDNVDIENGLYPTLKGV